MLGTLGMISAPIPAHPSRPQRIRFAVRRWPGWSMQLPCLPVRADAHIGPLLSTTCGASVGRGVTTPRRKPHCSDSPGRGRAPSRPAGKGVVLHQYPLVRNAPPSRRGGPMCPPGHASSWDSPRGRHIGRPLQSRLQYPSIPGQRAGTEPRPYSRQIPNAGSRYARPSSTPSPTRQSVRNDSGHQSLHLPSPVPTSPVNARSEAPALRLSKISRNSGIVSKGRAAALPLVVSRRPGGKYEIPWKSFLERERIFF